MYGDLCELLNEEVQLANGGGPGTANQRIYVDDNDELAVVLQDGSTMVIDAPEKEWISDPNEKVPSFGGN